MGKNDNYKLGIIISALLAILVALGGVMCAGEVTEKVVSQNKMHVEEVTVQISENISSKIESYLHNLNLIARNLILSDAVSSEELSKILRFEIDSGLFSEIVAVDLNGYGIDSHNNIVDIGDEQFFENTKKGVISVSDPLNSEKYYKNIIVYSVPIVENGNIIGVICGINNSDLVENQLKTQVYDNQGCYYIINKEGTLVLENHISKDHIGFYEKEAADDFIQEVKLKDAKILDSGVNIKYITGEQRYVAYSKIKSSNDWYIVTTIPMSTVFIDAQHIIEITIAILAICIFAFIIISFYIIKSNYVNRKKLDKAVFEDHLTEINNYEKFIIDCNEFLKTSDNTSYALIVFDIEKFKLLNDIYGYQVGDNILKEISKNLRKIFKDSAIYGRLTGDTFGLLIDIVNKEDDIHNISKIIKEEIANTKNMNSINLNIKIDTSIGIYLIGDNDEYINIKKIIDNADMARFKSKSMKHIDYLVFDEAMREEKKKKVKIEQDLLNAIENEEFNIYYQPKFNIITGEIIGSEALIRWNHPIMGFIRPDKFIPIAEKNGHINEIGKWVFNEVCKTLRMWSDEGIEIVPVSVNLSRVELYQDNLIKFLEETLSDYNVSPELVELEITETSTLNDMNFISDKVYQIKDLGIKVAMDDFGAGNSNIGNLKDIPMDVIKIDRSILIDIETNIKSKVVVESIINISNHLNLDVVCEGVERMEQVEILKSIGCKVIQGYVFSKPINKKQYKYLLKCKAKSKTSILESTLS